MSQRGHYRGSNYLPPTSAHSSGTSNPTSTPYNTSTPTRQSNQTLHPQSGGNHHNTYGNYSSTPIVSSSPYSSSPSPGGGNPISGGSFQARGASQSLKKYELKPPADIAPLHKGMEMGYPDIFFQRLTQEEDQLTESNVRNGFVDKPAVQNEQMCAFHDVIHKSAEDPKIIRDLGNFMVDVLKRKREAGRISGTSTFKPPNRATLNDQKKEQWMQNLANGSIELKELSRNVPHGFKGEKLLEALASKQVPLVRATWYIKIVGLHEMTGRQKPSLQNQYSSEWTNVINIFIKKQINETVKQSSTAAAAAAAAASSATSGSQHIFTPDATAKWHQRYLYTLSLAQHQYSEGLLDQGRFLKTQLDDFARVGFDQMWLMCPLIRSFLGEFERNRVLTKQLVETVVGRLAQLLQHPNFSSSTLWRYSGLERDLKGIIQATFLSTPDMYVIPKLYSTHRTLLEQILLHSPLTSTGRPTIEQTAVKNTMRHFWYIIKARNEIFLEGLIPSDGEKDEESVDDEELRIRVLDGIGSSGSVDRMSEIAVWFLGNGDNEGITHKEVQPTFEAHLYTLCNWAVTPLRKGDWRVHVASRLLLLWRDTGTDEGNSSSEERGTMIQEGLLHFLDVWESDSEECDSVAKLFGEFIRTGIFSYPKYLSRLIARGDLQGSRRTEEGSQRHLSYLQHFPLYNAQPWHMNQRRIALYGVSGGDEGEIRLFEGLCARIERSLVYMFSPEASEWTQSPVDDIIKDFPLSLSLDFELSEALKNAGRYIQIRITSGWLFEIVKKFVVKNVLIGEDNWRVMTSPGSSLLNSRQFSTIIRILEVAQDYGTLIDLVLWTLDKSMERSIYPIIIDTFRRHGFIWKMMNKEKEIWEALIKKHQQLESKAGVERCLVIYLCEMMNEGLEITEDVRIQLQTDLQLKPIPSSLLIHQSSKNLSSPLQELDSLLTRPSYVSASQIAISLCYQAQQTPGSFDIPDILDYVVNILKKLQAKPGIDIIVFQTTMRIYVDVFREIGNRTSLLGRLDDIAVGWLKRYCGIGQLTDIRDPPNPELFVEDESGMWFLMFLVMLVARNVIRLEVLVREFCVECLERAAKGTTGDQQNDGLLLCKNVIVLLRLLLVEQTWNVNVPVAAEEGKWQMQLEDIQYFITQRNDLANLQSLNIIFKIVYYLASIESTVQLNHSIFPAIQLLRKELVNASWLKDVCLANVDLVYERFMRNEDSDMSVAGKKTMVDIFQQIVGDKQTETPSTSPAVHTLSLTKNFAKFKAIFSQVNKWTSDRSRINAWLLLDRLLLSGRTDGQGDIVMQGAETSGKVDEDETVSAFVEFFFDRLVLGGEVDLRFVRRLIRGLKKEIVSELLGYGEAILRGAHVPNATFPESILLYKNRTLNTIECRKVMKSFHQVISTLVYEANGHWTEDRKIGLLNDLLAQVRKFEEPLRVYDVMHACNVSYPEACKALIAATNSTDVAITTLKTEGFIENPGNPPEAQIMLRDIRASLLIRLRLLVPLLPIIWQNPTKCEMMDWIMRLVILSMSTLVHGNGTQERFFEFILDLVSVLGDEVPKDARKNFLNQLTSIQGEHTIPAVFASRLKRILPFQSHNVYMTNLKFTVIPTLDVPTGPALAPTPNISSSTSQPRPWDWLEDCVSDASCSDNDVPISLALFGAKKVKRIEGSFVKWFRWGFGGVEEEGALEEEKSSSAPNNEDRDGWGGNETPGTTNGEPGVSNSENDIAVFPTDDDAVMGLEHEDVIETHASTGTKRKLEEGEVLDGF